jgi:hypothetical protein
MGGGVETMSDAEGRELRAGDKVKVDYGNTMFRGYVRTLTAVSPRGATFVARNVPLTLPTQIMHKVQ